MSKSVTVHPHLLWLRYTVSGCSVGALWWIALFQSTRRRHSAIEGTCERLLKSLLAAARCLIIIVAIGGISCSLFSPRTVEPPSGTVSDPLKLTSILANTGCFYRSNAYEDIFSDLIIYDNNGYPPKTTSKQTLIQRLNVITIDKPAFMIEWGEDPNYTWYVKGDTGVVYQRYFIRPQGNQTPVSDSGASEFRLLRSPGGTSWSIYYWKDESLTPGARSVFNPVQS